MGDFLVTEKTGLRVDPDDSSPEFASLDANSRVVRLHDLGPWAKVSTPDRRGWLHANVLRAHPETC